MRLRVLSILLLVAAVPPLGACVVAVRPAPIGVPARAVWVPAHWSHWGWIPGHRA